MMDNYIPQRGDVVWIDIHPQTGHEQAGRRPAIVLSPKSYNDKVGLALLCPVTNRIKGYPFEVIVPSGLKTTGTILSDQIKSLDWRMRNTEYCDKVPETVVLEIFKKLSTLLRFDR